MNRINREIKEYLAGKRRRFTVKVPITGTRFTRRVLSALSKIPYGKTLTYAQLAAKAGYPGAARAVGGVMARNKYPIILPCHRVVAKHGLGGYSGGLKRKKFLLNLESHG